MGTPNKTPDIDLMNDALKHYDELSNKSHNWLSTIPKTIKFYFKNKDKINKLQKENEELKTELIKVTIDLVDKNKEVDIYKNVIGEVVHYLNRSIPTKSQIHKLTKNLKAKFLNADNGGG